MDILSRTDHDNTYSDLMSKETKVLDTVNAVVKHYQQTKPKNERFTSLTVADMANAFVTDMSKMFTELVDSSKSKNPDYMKIFTGGNRLIYLGILVLFISFIMALAAF
jgi:hypothetical protein